MNKTWLKDRNTQIVIACLIALLLVYTVDVFHLDLRLTSWESLGPTSIVPARLLYLVADTPDIIGYIEKETGERVECAEAVAYVATASGETYRCCQAETRVSCVAGDFSSEILPGDAACNEQLTATFGAPTSLPGAKDYQIYGSCIEGGSSQLTVAQVNADDQIQWKTVDIFAPGVANSALRCLLGPALLALLVRTIVVMRRKPDPDREMRKW